MAFALTVIALCLLWLAGFVIVSTALMIGLGWLVSTLDQWLHGR